MATFGIWEHHIDNHDEALQYTIYHIPDTIYDVPSWDPHKFRTLWGSLIPGLGASLEICESPAP